MSEKEALGPGLYRVTGGTVGTGEWVGSVVRLTRLNPHGLACCVLPERFGPLRQGATAVLRPEWLQPEPLPAAADFSDHPLCQVGDGPLKGALVRRRHASSATGLAQCFFARDFRARRLGEPLTIPAASLADVPETELLYGPEPGDEGGPAVVLLNAEEARSLYGLIADLSGHNPESVFAWDGTDLPGDPLADACARLFAAAGARIPDSLRTHLPPHAAPDREAP